MDGPPGIWPVFWDAAKAAGFFGTLVMTVMWWLARRDLDKEREKDDARHTATMEVLHAIKIFMEIIRDRFPRT